MEKKKLFQELAQAADLATEPFPGAPLVELSGNSRALIEHHQGVTGYSENLVSIRVRGGCIEISGENLMLACMSQERLILRGRIDRINLYWGH